MALSERIQQEQNILTQIEMGIRGFNCVLPPSDVELPTIYASCPVTSGKRMYDLFRQFNATSLEQLNSIDPKLYSEQILQANILEGEQFGSEIRARGYARVIVPGVFFARGWTQHHYMSLWEQVIKRFATSISFNHDWMYSNGCVQEYLVGLREEIDLVDRANMKPLPPDTALASIKIAIEEIDALGADASMLYDTYRRIHLCINPPTLITGQGRLGKARVLSE